MLWARMVAYVPGTANQELLLRNEYLGAENRILRGQIKGRLLFSEGEKATLAEIAQRLGRKALEELAAVAKPDTLPACVLIDESQNKRVFFTAGYSGDDSAQRTYETQFTAWVVGRYDRVIGDASCRFDKSRSVAMMSREDDKTVASRQNRAVIETNWCP